MAHEAKREAIGRAIQARSEAVADRRQARGSSPEPDPWADLEAALRATLSDTRDRADELRADPRAAQAALDGVGQALAACEQLLSERQSDWAPFQVRLRQNVLQDLAVDFRARQAELEPVRRFGFKGRKTKTGGARPARPAAPVRAPTTPADVTGLQLSRCQGQSVTWPAERVQDQAVLLQHLTDCRVMIAGNPSTVHMSHLQGCTILLGPVTTSVFIDDSADCTFVLACQQLRTHRTRRSRLYVHVTAKAIVEDCQAVQFAPYALDYPDLAEHRARAGLDPNINHWDRVDDFNWLATDRPSPHWSLLPVTERQTFVMPTPEPA